MDLAFTPEEQQFREDIRTWVLANLPADISHKVHHALRLSKEDMQRWARILGKKGWLGHGWPKAFGGPGWNAVQKHLFEEECALAGAPRVVPFGPVMVAPVIMAFGNTEQQQRFLPGIASGEVWWSQGYSEPGSGSDAAALKTKAEKVEGGWRLNGTKQFISGAGANEIYVAMVRTGEDGPKGISCLVIEKGMAGVSFGANEKKMGWNSQPTRQVIFEDVRIPASRRVGALLLAKRYSRTALTRARHSGMARNSSGGQSPSHRHHRS